METTILWFIMAQSLKHSILSLVMERYGFLFFGTWEAPPPILIVVENGSKTPVVLDEKKYFASGNTAVSYRSTASKIHVVACVALAAREDGITEMLVARKMKS